MSESVEALGVQCHKDLALQARKSGVIAWRGVNFKKKGTPWAPRSFLKKGMLTTWAYFKAVNCRDVVNCTACAYVVCILVQWICENESVVELTRNKEPTARHVGDSEPTTRLTCEKESTAGLTC